MSLQARITDPSLIALEAIRGYAAIVVVFHHFAHGFTPAFQNYMTWGIQSYTLGWLLNGAGAVYLFFLLSGFVLSIKYFQTGETSALIAGAVKRLPRLWPPAAFGVLIGYLALRFGLNYNAEAAQLTGSAWLAHYGYADQSLPPTALGALRETALLFFQDRTLAYNTNLWTMVLEFYGSLLSFFAAYVVADVLKDSRVTWQKIALVASVLIATSLLREWLGCAFTMGVVLAYLYANKIFVPKPVAITFMIVGLALLGSHWQTRSMIGGALIVWGCTTPSATPRFLTGPLGRLVGRWSFPIYITHTVVICTASSFVFLQTAGLGVPLQLLATLATTWGIAIILAYPIVRWEQWYLPILNRQAKAFTRDFLKVR